MAEDLKKMYRTIMDDHFPPQMEISFIDEGRRQTLFYEKVVWTIDNVQKGLRYGENPGQEAALYRLANGNLTLGETVRIFDTTAGFSAINLNSSSVSGFCVCKLANCTSSRIFLASPSLWK